MSTSGMANMITLHGMVVVKMVNPENESVDGVTILRNGMKKQFFAIISSFGKCMDANDSKLIPIASKIVDLAMINEYTGQELVIDGEKFLVITIDEVLH